MMTACGYLVVKESGQHGVMSCLSQGGLRSLIALVSIMKLPVVFFIEEAFSIAFYTKSFLPPWQKKVMFFGSIGLSVCLFVCLWTTLLNKL